MPDIISKGLDGCLDYWGYEQRDEGKPHDALEDCHCAAKVFMKLMELPPINVVEGGFVSK